MNQSTNKSPTSPDGTEKRKDGEGKKPDPKDRLIQAIQALSLARDLETVMEIVRQAGHALTGADGTSFILRDGDLCYYADEEAIGPLWKGKRFPITHCLSGWAMLNRQPAVIEDIYDDPRTPVDAYRPTFVQSVAMVPIRTAAPIGAIGSYWAARHLATADEIRLLQALADSTAAAMENIERYENLERKMHASEQASKIRSRALSMISYELRSPLHSIIGYTDLLVDGTYGALESEQQRPLKRIQRNAADLLRLADNILNLTRFEWERRTVRAEGVDLAPLLRELILDVRPLIEQKSIFLRLNVSVDLCPLESDPGIIRQILINLLSNAVKFTQQGEIHIVARARPEKGGAEISIRDTGVGIPEAELSRIFEPFQQIDESSTREFDGASLGLAVVKQLLDLLRGSIQVESEVGRGSTLTIFLPYR